MNKQELLKVAKSILFNSEMVKAILDGRKTVTRRVVKDVNEDYKFIGWITSTTGSNKEIGKAIFHSFYYHAYVKPRYKIGDILYVRETIYRSQSHGGWRYMDQVNPNIACAKSWKKIPSIHMPKECARIFLKVTGVRVERLQDITEEQAIKEGFIPCPDYIECEYSENPVETGLHLSAKKQYLQTMKEIYKVVDGYVFVYEFEVLEEG